MMAAFGDGVGPPVGAVVALAARARRTSASVRPAPNAPMRRKFRRLMPSQKRRRSPRNVSINNPPRQDSGTCLGPYRPLGRDRTDGSMLPHVGARSNHNNEKSFARNI